MLVIISDIHLTDNEDRQDISSDAFRILRKQLCNLSYAASYRPDGTYKPIEKVHVVLLGDILDVIRSDKWLESSTRPWDEDRGPAFEAKVQEITDGILRNNSYSLEVLKSISQGDEVKVPKRTTRLRGSSVDAEQAKGEKQEVKVSVHYQIGNHDWFYHLPGSAYDAIRRKVVDAMGLANDPDVPFPHEPSESADLVQVYRDHEVFARHGDIYDSFNFEKSRDASSLGDAIVVEILNRFPNEVKKQMGGAIPEECIEGISAIDDVRPILLIPVWLHGLLERTCKTKKQRRKVKAIWNGLAEEFLELDFVRKRDRWAPWDEVSRLKFALLFSREMSIPVVGDVASWARRVYSGDDESHENAFREPEFLSRRARFVVHGHTHRQKVVPLDVSMKHGRQFDQFYVNTGTWRCVHEQARLRPAENQFVGYSVMTYSAFFQADERKGRRFETWSGSLDARVGDERRSYSHL